MPSVASESPTNVFVWSAGDATLSVANDEGGRTTSHESDVLRLVSEAALDANLPGAGEARSDSDCESVVEVDNFQPGGTLNEKLGLFEIQEARSSCSDAESEKSEDSLLFLHDGCAIYDVSALITP